DSYAYWPWCACSCSSSFASVGFRILGRNSRTLSPPRHFPYLSYFPQLLLDTGSGPPAAGTFAEKPPGNFFSACLSLSLSLLAKLPASEHDIQPVFQPRGRNASFAFLPPSLFFPLPCLPLLHHPPRASTLLLFHLQIIHQSSAYISLAPALSLSTYLLPNLPTSSPSASHRTRQS
ncbi:hypothetical protein LZ32DRAFT_595050, partial [Colletotrichum eremochloae]